MKWTMIFPLCCVSLAVWSQNPQPDTTFSDDGIQVASIWTTTIPRCIATQADQKILVGGNMSKNNPNRQSHVIIRYNTDGSLDTDFAEEGVFYNDSNDNFRTSKMIVQPDQKILWGGIGNGPLVARITADGQWDETFGTEGMNHFENLSGNVLDMHLFDDGSFIAMGLRGHNAAHGVRMAKFTSDGQLDAEFGSNGIVFTNFGYTRATPNAMAVQSDGKIIIGLTAIIENTGSVDPPTLVIVARFLPNGTLDTTFGDNGYISHDTAITRLSDIAVDAEDRIVCAGEYGIGFADTGTSGRSGIIRLLGDGEWDTSFNNNTGEVQVNSHQYADYASAIEVDSNGHIYFSGSSPHPTNTYWMRSLMRLTSEGVPDPQFGTNGFYLSNIRNYNGESTNGQNNLAFTSQGKLVVVGHHIVSGSYRGTVAQFVLDTTLSEGSQEISSFTAYPNPFDNFLTLNNTPAQFHVKIINVIGQHVFEGENINQINTSSWSKGYYTLQISTPSGQFHTLKMLK